MIHVTIVEDQKQESERLSEMIRAYAEEYHLDIHIAIYGDAELFLNTYSTSTDIVFMDIELPGKNGMDACRELRKKDRRVIIVFVTNMAQFAIEGYEVEALDFVVKPVKYASFRMKMDKVVEKVSSNRNDSFVCMIDRKTVVLPAHEIQYIQVNDHSIDIHMENKILKSRGSLSSLEEELQRKNFIRCNNYCLVNLSAVIAVEKDDIILKNDRIHMSRSRKKEFLSALANYLGRN